MSGPREIRIYIHEPRGVRFGENYHRRSIGEQITDLIERSKNKGELDCRLADGEQKNTRVMIVRAFDPAAPLFREVKQMARRTSLVEVREAEDRRQALTLAKKEIMP